MSITIENPTAESVWQAIQQLPQSEIERLKELLSNEEATAAEESAWRAASAQAATRFFDEEEA